MSQPRPPYGRPPHRPHQPFRPGVPPAAGGPPHRPYGAPYGPHGPAHGAPQRPLSGPPVHPRAPGPDGPYERHGPDEPHGSYEPQPGYPRPGYPAPLELDLPIASIPRRAGARLIDSGLLGIFGFAVVLPIMIAVLGADEPAADVRQSGGGWSPSTAFAWFLVVAGLPFVYEAVQLALWGKTIGKRVLGLRVVTVDPPGAGLPIATAATRAAINNILYLFGCGIGTLMAYLWAIWGTPLRQTIHDRLAGTVVIDDRVEYEEEE